MPRLRQRMRCRRGVSRGQASVPPPSPLSELSSSSESDDHTPPPASRRGEGRGRGRGRRAESSSFAGRGRGHARVSGGAPSQPSAPPMPPCQSSPPDPPVQPSQPLPRDVSAPPSRLNPPGSRFRGSTIRQTTQNVELHFHCTSFNSIITALITVSLREEIPLTASPTPPIDPRPNPTLQIGMRSEDENQDMKTDSQAGKVDSSDENEYACRIEEEPMSSEHES